MKYITLAIVIAFSVFSFNANSNQKILAKHVHIVISMEDQKVYGFDEMLFTAKYTNVGSSPIIIGTDKLPDDIGNLNFKVFYAGNWLKYKGIKLKRSPYNRQTITINPSQTIEIEFSLDAKFILYNIGSYKVRFYPDVIGLENKSIRRASNYAEISFEVLENRKEYLIQNQPLSLPSQIKKWRNRDNALSADSPLVSTCSPSQSYIVHNAYQEEKAMSIKAYSHTGQTGLNHTDLNPTASTFII